MSVVFIVHFVLKEFSEMDRFIETPAQELVEIGQEVLNTSRDTVLKVYGILGTGVAAYVGGQIDYASYLLGIVLIIDKKRIYLERQDLGGAEECLSKDAPNRFFRTLLMIGGAPFISAIGDCPYVIIHILDIVIYSYICNRYHDTGSKMRDSVKSKVEGVLKSLNPSKPLA